MKIIVLGSPGVGKGTYTQELVKEYNLLHISTGDIFRKNIKEQTELGKKADEYISQGRLVPDEVTIGMVKERLSEEDCQSGFILDGFPRTIAQAEALQGITDIDLVIHFMADEEVIIERLGGRLTCRKCGRIFHKKNIPPKVEGVCDSCGGELYTRADDNPESIKERLRVYEQQTAPLIEFYKEKGLLREIMVNEDFGTHGKEIMGKIMKVIGGVGV